MDYVIGRHGVFCALRATEFLQIHLLAVADDEAETPRGDGERLLDVVAFLEFFDEAIEDFARLASRHTNKRGGQLAACDG